MKRHTLILIVFFILAAVMSGCGRKGDPRPPEKIVSAEGLISQDTRITGSVDIARLTL